MKIAIVDDEQDMRQSISQWLALSGFDTETYGSAEDALKAIGPDFPGVVVTDVKMPGMDGMAFLKRLMGVDSGIPVILITGHGDVPLAVQAMRAGAYDFIEKPFPVNRLSTVIERALEKRRLVLENRALREQLADRSGMEGRLVGRSPPMERLRRLVGALAGTDADVLIIGETGAGKEVVARALHEEGHRRNGPFVALNCGGLPAEIIESELFGHEKGAFTGAARQRIGKLEHAHGGTVFLDEIESMPLDLQVKLLRVIETRSIERLGSNASIPLDVRFLAATKEDLEAAGNSGRFRKDLFYRLNVVTLEIPPLRARKEDIPLLFHHLTREARARYRREIPDASTTYIATLMARDWPGNVRELRNVADRFVLGLEALDPLEAEVGRSLSERVAAYEKAVIAEELARNEGSLKATYEGLGLSRKALYEKIRRHGLERDGASGEEAGAADI